MGLQVDENGDPLPHSKRLKYFTTAAIMLGNLTFGCAFNFYNPAVEDFRAKYDTNVDDISTVFTIMLIAYCSGALSSGIIYNFINRQLGVIVCLGGMAFALYFTPHCTSKTVFFVTGGILGFFVGAYDASQVVWIIEIWQEKAGPFIEAQHFCYAVGSNIPSLLLAPFLTAESEDDDDNNKVTTSSTTQAPEEESRMWIPFAIAGTLSAIATLSQLLLFIFLRYYVPPLYQNQNKEELENSESDSQLQSDKQFNNNNNDEEKSKAVEVLDPEPQNLDFDTNSKSQLAVAVANIEGESELTDGNWIQRLIQSIVWPKLRLIILTGIFLGTYQGMEMCTMQFLPTYGQYSDLDLSESKSAQVLTGLTAAFAVGRFFGIFIIMKVSPVPLLFVNLILVLGGNIILLLWANDDLTMFWTGAIMIGAGFSTIFPSFSAFMEKNLIFSNAIGSFMIVCGSAVAAIYPVIVGGNIEDNPVSLTYTSFFSIVSCTVSLTVGYFLTRNSNIRY